MQNHTLTVCIIILISFLICNLVYSANFPTYKEVQACHKDEIDCERISKYKNYQPDEIKRILEGNHFAYKFSLGIQQSNSEDGNLLWQILNRGTKNPAVFSAFLSICIMQDISENAAYKRFSNFAGYSTLINSFRNISPNNSLPYYLDAYFKYKNKDYQQANRDLINAAKIQNFSHYSKEIYHYSIETSKETSNFLLYPKYLAINMGMDNAVIASSPLVFKRLADLVFQQNNIPSESCASVFHLGEQLESNSFMLMTKLVGNSLKMRSLKYQEKKTDELHKRHQDMLSIYDKFLPLSQNFDESQLYLYFDRVLEINELNAMKELINNP